MNMRVKQGHGVSLLIAYHHFVPFIFSLQFIKDSVSVRGSIQSPRDTDMSKTDTLSVLIEFIQFVLVCC